jgi:hypothetical protein
MNVNPDARGRRTAVLRRWRASIVGAAGPVPTEADLERIAESGVASPPSVDRASVAPWEPTIRFLLEKVAVGHPDPVGALPPHLRRPVSTRRDTGWSWDRRPRVTGPRPAAEPDPQSTAGPAPVRPAPAPEPPGSGSFDWAPVTGGWTSPPPPSASSAAPPPSAPPRPAPPRPTPATPASTTPGPSAPEPAHETSPAGSGAAADGPTDPVLERLVRWREKAIAEGIADASRLRVSFLRSLARQGMRSVEEIASSLPPAVAHLAPALSAALRDRGPTTTTGDDRPQPGPPPSAASASASAAASVPEEPDGAPDEGPVVDARLKGVRFARFDEQGRKPPTGRLTVTPGPTGGVVLTWDEAGAAGTGRHAAADEAAHGTGRKAGRRAGREAGRDDRDPVVIYRVVSDDHGQPYGPEDEYADTIAVTVERTATDDRPCTRGVRHFAVWYHEGATEAEAAGNQPVLLATSTHVAPPRDVEVHYDHPRVVGGWHQLDGTDDVMVFRVRPDHGRQSEPEPDWDGYEKLDEGFKDSRPEPGAMYIYLIRSAVRQGSSFILSEPVSCRMRIPESHEPVTDLELVQREVVDERNRVSLVFDLSWTPPPAGKVRIYRTTESPADGLVGHGIGTAALESDDVRLRDADRLRDQPSIENGRAVLRAVPWPDKTHRVHFTPVTVLNDQAQVGPTRAASRLGTVEKLRCVERTAEQVITFEWPPGATEVWLYRGRAGSAEAPVLDERDQGFTREQYERTGGIRMQLDPRGEAVHLLPVLHVKDGPPKRGEIASLEYPGLVRLDYQVRMQRRRDGGVDVAVQVWADRDDVDPPPFALVYNPERLPLWWDDRDSVRLRVRRVGHDAPETLIRLSMMGRQPTDIWEAVVDRPDGFVRLCVAPAPTTMMFALQDPPVWTLRLAAAVGDGAAATEPLRRRRRRWWEWFLWWRR